MTKQVVLSTAGAGTWTVPSDWNNSDYTIELIGAAANGTNQFFAGLYLSGGSAGAGGQYAVKTSSDVTPMVLTPGSTVNYQVGTGGTNSSTVAGVPGAYFAWDTWFNTSSSVFAQGSWMDFSGGGVIAHQGQYHPPGLGVGGTAPFPWHWNDGGHVDNVDSTASASGGGGAGGPAGPGGAGGHPDGLWEGAGGGGGANNGASGGQNFNSGGGFVGFGGGNGGNNRLGAGGGLGSYGTLGGPSALAADGTAGGGGGGGYGRRDGGSPAPGPPANAWYSNGANGSTDVIWGGSYGPGGGGGGGGGGNCPIPPDSQVGGVGGNGGQYGGGGGGSATPSGPVGLGGQGLIVITYTPIPPTKPNKGTVYNRITYMKRSKTTPPFPGQSPTIQGVPTINQAVIGQVSTCTTGNWSGPTPITFNYQWKLNGVNISGQTSNTYTPVNSDLGKTLTCSVTGTNTFGNTTYSSNGILVILI